MRHRVSFFAALLLAVSACTGGSNPTTTAAETTLPDNTSTTSVPAQSTTTTDTFEPLREVELLGEELPPDTETQLLDLVVAAQLVRELPFLTPPKVRVVTNEELAALVREDIEENSEDLPADEALYQALGLLAEEADLEAIVTDLYGEQVAGFYDGEIGEMVVPARDGEFSLLQQGTVIHELVHALTDQHFQFHGVFEAMIEEERLDEASAYQALIEGDASFAELEWIGTLSQREIGQILAETLTIDSSALDGAPRFLTESLFFPYQDGLTFTQSLFSQSGWAAVNAAYDDLVTLPGSTEQILNPSDFAVDLPVPVALPEVDLDGYTLERTSVWGELGFQIMLNQGSGVTTLSSATDGWAGDAYYQWFNGEEAALLIAYQGDTDRDVDEMESALEVFAAELAPSDSFVEVIRADGLLYFVVADIEEVGQQIVTAVGG